LSIINVAIAASDLASKLFKCMFPKSSVANSYQCGRTKTTAIVLQQCKSIQEGIVSNISSQPFSIATDGSNDSEKLYPIVVRYFDNTDGVVTEALLSVPTCDGASTGENIFTLLDDDLKKRNVSWNNCIAFESDNASVMTGCNKGVFGHITMVNPSVYLSGCSCHLIHLAAKKGADMLPISFDDLLVDISYYLDKSVNRQMELKDLQTLCGKEQRKILKHCVTRWLSLGEGIKRLLEQWEPLQIYFSKETKKQEVKSKRAKAKSRMSEKVSSSKDKVPHVSSNKEGNNDSTGTCSKALSCEKSRSPASTTIKSASAGKTEKIKPKIGSLGKAKSQKLDEKALSRCQTPLGRNDLKDSKKNQLQRGKGYECLQGFAIPEDKDLLLISRPHNSII
jgi:hypothetical protein